MEQGRTNAMRDRNLGRPVGKPAAGWSRKRADIYATTDPQSWEWLCEEARREWRLACRQAQNDFAAACLNGPHDEPAGWEFH